MGELRGGATVLRPTGLFYSKNVIDMVFPGISQMIDQYDVSFKFIDTDVLADEQCAKTVPAHQDLLAKYAHFREIGQLLDLPQHLVGKPSGNWRSRLTVGIPL